MTELLLVLLVQAVTACGGGPPLYGPKSCEDDKDSRSGQIAYLPANASAAVCMPPEAAVYITCVRELSQANFSSTSSKSVTLPAVSIDGVSVGQVANAATSAIKSLTDAGAAAPAQGGVPGLASSATVTIGYSDDGRKAAFDYCKAVAVSALQAEVGRAKAAVTAAKATDKDRLQAAATAAEARLAALQAGGAVAGGAGVSQGGK